jgi:plasmid replication initiation protein
MLTIDSLNCVKDDDGTYSVSAHLCNKSVYENTDVLESELNNLFGKQFADVLRGQEDGENVAYSGNEINNLKG